MESPNMNTTITTPLQQRCQDTCELCASDTAVSAYAVSPKNNDLIENEVALCAACLSELQNRTSPQHWQCLAGSIWNTEPSVQALSYRILHSIREQAWAEELISSVELDESVTAWAMSAYEEKILHRDSQGNLLSNGDTVVLIQGLSVKGANFTAPKGTIVKKIRLVADNAEQIEGKINEQTIVLLTKYLRKSS